MIIKVKFTYPLKQGRINVYVTSYDVASTLIRRCFDVIFFIKQYEPTQDNLVTIVFPGLK